jgi:hypothetical protein
VPEPGLPGVPPRTGRRPRTGWLSRGTSSVWTSSPRIGTLRYAEHRAVPEIHRDLVGRGLAGSSAQDWFLFQAGEDRATDLHDEAFVNDLDFING